jgi:serine/threonine-protein kinase
MPLPNEDLAAVVTLSVLSGDATALVRSYRDTCYVVAGRGEDADLLLSDPYVSRRHVLFEISPPSCRIQDLAPNGGESTNAPLVNGRPVRHKELADGDVIELGYTRLRFAVRWEPVAITVPPPPRPDAAPDSDKRPVAAPGPDKPLRVECPRCGKDLTAQANSDGRALDLADAVTHVCADCLPKSGADSKADIGGYLLIEELGSGGMGTVHLAWHAATCRLVAVKLIKDLADAAAGRRFDREVRVLRRLSHPGIVRFIDSGVHPNGPFVVTEYVAGGNPGRCRQSTGSMPAAEAVRLTAGVLEALHYVHTWPIVHRDIKPDNILLTKPSAGTKPLAKLSDFGIALFYERAGGTRLTAPNKFMGTLRFIAPEQARDARNASVLSDIYSVGATLYYLLTGLYVFDFPTEEEMKLFRDAPPQFRSPQDAARAFRRLERLMYPWEILFNERPVPVLSRDRGAPRQVAAVVDKAVAKDPAARFPDCPAFRTALLHAAAADGLAL